MTALDQSVPPPVVPSSTVSESTFGPRLAVVAVARTVFVPATSEACTVTVRQVVHAPVPGKDRPVAMVVPLREMLIGRSTVVPLAYRRISRTWRACGESVAHSTDEPVTLSSLTKPVPVNP